MTVEAVQIDVCIMSNVLLHFPHCVCGMTDLSHSRIRYKNQEELKKNTRKVHKIVDK